MSRMSGQRRKSTMSKTEKNRPWMAAVRSGRGKSSESRAEIEMSFEQVLLQSGRGVGTMI